MKKKSFAEGPEKKEKNKRYCGFCAAAVLLMLLVGLPASVSAKEPLQKGDMVFGASAGYMSPQGYYSDTIRNAPFAELYVIPYTMNLFYLSGRAGYGSYSLAGSSGSAIRSALLSAGPSLYYAKNIFAVHGGLSADMRYLYLYTERTGEKLQTVKAGISADAGLYMTLPAGFLLNAGARYAVFSLSGKRFHETSVLAGISFNTGFMRRSGKIIEKKSDTLSAFAEGVKEYNARNIFKAQVHFKKASDNGRNTEAVSYLEKIDAIIKDYNEANSLIERGRPYDAIPLLEKNAPLMNESADLLIQTRRSLAGEIRILEKQGIEAYDAKDYKTCIILMKRISIIDPDNRTAQIYLPRAMKREEAMQKLR